MYEPSCSSCLGLHVVCEETSSPVIRPYAHSSFDFRENTIETWGPEYKMSLNIKHIYTRPTSDAHQFHFYTGNSCGDISLHWIAHSSRLSFGYCVNNVASTFVYEINRLVWTTIEIGQRLVGQSSYEFYIKIRLGFRKFYFKESL